MAVATVSNYPSERESGGAFRYARRGGGKWGVCVLEDESIG